MSKYRATYVMVDGEKVNTRYVKFVDIEEGLHGEDIMTFEYEGNQHKSAVYIGR